MFGLKTQILDTKSKDILRKSLGLFISKQHQSHSVGRINSDELQAMMDQIESITELLYLKYTDT